MKELEKNLSKYLVILLLAGISAFGCAMSMIDSKGSWVVMDWVFFIAAIIVNGTIQSERHWLVRYMGVALIFWLPMLCLFSLILKH